MNIHMPPPLSIFILACIGDESGFQDVPEPSRLDGSLISIAIVGIWNSPLPCTVMPGMFFMSSGVGDVVGDVVATDGVCVVIGIAW
jgi:hypothetical protein